MLVVRNVVPYEMIGMVEADSVSGGEWNNDEIYDLHGLKVIEEARLVREGQKHRA